ncbi:hypothetical protein DFH11DRAFT_1724477 [Phellopilus nigrolimitatus]|nr:hypothetical protein DFH11DRAFT_1724477 [Phellopilus nigrolimitatus]
MSFHNAWLSFSGICRLTIPRTTSNLASRNTWTTTRLPSPALPLFARLSAAQAHRGLHATHIVYFSSLNAFFVQDSFSTATALHFVLLASSALLFASQSANIVGVK